MIGLGHQVCTVFAQELRDLLGFQQPGKRVVQQHQAIAQLVVAALGGLQHQGAAFLQFQADRHARFMFFAQFVAEAGEGIDPGFDAVFMRALLGDAERPLPAIVAHIVHDHAVPAFILPRSPADQHRQFVVAIGEHFAGDIDPLANHRLDSELAIVDHRHGAFDSDPG